MRISDKNGKVDINFTKSETTRFLEVAYLATRVARNADAPQSEEAAKLAEACRVLAHRYGGQYLDENGELIEARKPDLSEAPATASEQPPAAHAATGAGGAGY
ncbi:MAG: hypothetical protein AAGF31_00865 [Planctomycetota bacterium]